MKTLLIYAMLASIGVLYLDDKTKRSALDQAQAQIQAQSDMPQQIQALTAERDQLKLQVARLTGNVVGPAPTASWYQQRLNEAPNLLNGSTAAGHY